MLLSWRSSFRADVIGELGSAHIATSAVGPGVFTFPAVLPSGRPDEESHTHLRRPTWQMEYGTCALRQPETNIDTDIWINSVLHDAAAKVGVALQ
jgi:hypothetical protein